jgi:hypothetical protein
MKFEIDHWNLPLDLAQGGERVEPRGIWILVLGIFIIFNVQLIYATNIQFSIFNLQFRFARLGF